MLKEGGTTMSKRKTPVKKGKNNKGNYILTVFILLLFIGIIVHFSMKEQAENRFTVGNKISDNVIKKDTTIFADTVSVDPKGVKESNETIKTDDKTSVKDSITKKTDVKIIKKDTVNKNAAKYINPHLLTLPKIKDDKYVITNSDGRYVLYYSPQHRQPTWVAYVLSRSDVSKKVVEREDKFVKDKEVVKRGWVAADDSDYKRSGYDRGHLLPSADRDNSSKENKSTFLYSNISPQKARLNRGAWRDLEEQTRRWAMMYDSLCVITAGVLSDDKPMKSIGDNQVSVPNKFYKVILAKYKGEYYAICFLLPNDDSVDSDFRRYTVSVDSIESVTGIDFFYRLPDSIETKVEKAVDKGFWY